MSPNAPSLDAIVVGAGFSGIHMLHKLRTQGFNVKIFEASHDFGGTWFWNRYPGARVDSETPIYQLSAEKEIWSDFEWRERFPGREELMRYFHHADKKLGLSKDVCFNTRVVSAHWDNARNQWLVKSLADAQPPTYANHLVLCTGFASRRYTPPFEGLNLFKGKWYHSGVWPEEGVDVKGKKVAIIGTGASGVQIIQEIGPDVGHLTAYQRTPNLAIPMRQRWSDKPGQQYGRPGDGIEGWKFPSKDRYPAIFKNLRDTFGALVIDMDFTTQKFKDATPAEREALFQYLWDYGGFSYWLGTYKEMFFEQEVNDQVYAFWAKNVRARLNDPKMKDLLAPLKAPHAWGTKRPCLEQTFYEVFNQPNVNLINVRESPIIRITPDGVETKNEGVIPVDILILATGFDSVTGGVLDIDIRNGSGESIQDKWRPGTCTYLGLSTARFPNLYWFYGPQAPTAFSNGPTTGEIQGDWVADLMVRMRQAGKKRVEPSQQAEDKWTKELNDMWYASLMPPTDSWYQGANIPGKKREPLNYFGGIPAYIQALEASASKNYEGWVMA